MQRNGGTIASDHSDDPQREIDEKRDCNQAGDDSHLI
jgi:hypothetical protein